MNDEAINSIPDLKVDLIKQRIRVKGIRAEDIHHEGRLTEAQIQDIPTDKVFEWVKVGAWKKKHFERWLKAMRVIE